MLLKFTFGTIIEYTIIKLYYHQRLIIMQPKQIKYKQKKKGFLFDFTNELVNCGYL